MTIVRAPCSEYGGRATLFDHHGPLAKLQVPGAPTQEIDKILWETKAAD